MALSGVGGVPEPQKPQQTASGNQSAENDAVSIFNSLNTKIDNVIDEKDGIDASMLTALRNLVGGKVTLDKLKKAADKLPNFTYTKDNIVYNIQGQAIRTSNTKFDAKGNVASDKIEEYLFVKDADGNDLKVKVKIAKNTCVSNNAYKSIMEKLTSRFNSLSEQGKKDLAYEVSQIEIKAGGGNIEGTFDCDSHILTIYNKGGNGSETSPNVFSMPELDLYGITLAHEIGHAVDEDNDKSVVENENKIDITLLRKAAISKFHIEPIYIGQTYFLKSAAEFAAEYYAYMHVKDSDNKNKKFSIMQAMKESNDVEFNKAAAVCEEIWKNAREKAAEIPKDELQLRKNLSLLKGHNLDNRGYDNDFFEIGDKISSNNRALMKDEVLQQYYLYKIGKCDEATRQKFEWMEKTKFPYWMKMKNTIHREVEKLLDIKLPENAGDITK